MNDQDRAWWQAYLAALTGVLANPDNANWDSERMCSACYEYANRSEELAAKRGESASYDPPWTGHGRVELLGHRSYLGRIREVDRYGSRLGEVQELLASGEYGESHLFGGKSVYEIRTVSLEDALKELRPTKFVRCERCRTDLRTVAYGEPGWAEESKPERCSNCVDPCAECEHSVVKGGGGGGWECRIGAERDPVKGCAKFEECFGF